MPDTLRNLIVYICRCFIDQSFKRIILVLGHSGPEKKAVLSNARLEIAERWVYPLGYLTGRCLRSGKRSGRGRLVRADGGVPMQVRERQGYTTCRLNLVHK